MVKRNFDPASEIQDRQNFGEFGGVNPSITDSSTFTFMKAESMEGTFLGETEGCFLYARHWNPSNKYLADALAKMEGAEAAQVVGSGMAAISNVTMQICQSGDHIISSHTIYGGTYSLFHFYLPKFNIHTTLLDVINIESVKKAIKPNTKMIYCEAMSNPLLEIADIKALADLAHENGIKLVIDNTFTPMIFSPLKFGADVVVHSLTKFINGSSDTVAGAIIGTSEFINSLMDLNTGTTMLLGPTMDGVRSASVFKNLRTLHIRMMQHSKNAQYVAEHLEADGVSVRYPGLKSHSGHELMVQQMNSAYGFGGMVLIDCKTKENAYKLMNLMQEDNVGYLAVSLGFYKTLFSAPGSSTSSEIPIEEQDEMGLSSGLIRMSVGLDMDIERTYETIRLRLSEIGLIN
jgi:methionine-gamma-lyase